MDKEQYIAEATRRLKRRAAAQSEIADCDEWLDENVPKFGPVEAGGYWVGGRRTKSETYRSDAMREALGSVALVMSPDALLDILCGTAPDREPEPMLTNAQFKKLLRDKDCGKIIKDSIDEDPDGGMEETFGSWQFGPLKKKPSEEGYEFYPAPQEAAE